MQLTTSILAATLPLAVLAHPHSNDYACDKECQQTITILQNLNTCGKQCFHAETNKDLVYFSENAESIHDCLVSECLDSGYDGAVAAVYELVADICNEYVAAPDVSSNSTVPADMAVPKTIAGYAPESTSHAEHEWHHEGIYYPLQNHTDAAATATARVAGSGPRVSVVQVAATNVYYRGSACTAVAGFLSAAVVVLML
ncbi:hypothetical protein BJ741DRAFT_596735 [Chytriomyces cf. hyalinus JEL632]|nr:hypothetical protein BJ741DRAFT_596735 [Chytriomyces cf. hyalinus JEL632]